MISSTVSIWSILAITNWSGHSLLIGSFGATAVLLFAVPEAPLSQPRNLIGGHLISATIAVILVAVFGTNFFTIGISVGLSIFVMYLTHTLHPPGGATALIGVMGGAGIDFIFVPVLVGAIILLMNALFVNNFVHHRKYPVVWF
ncbi:HPP family protein [Leptospira sp. 2 VSF19]|uniref:HPP family protein n=1 Tax=Leptospira soteropolitanensis TaxID=2950025 RepID=A0AAW5VF81_9LEPT|nr:HPP family protein [Leptospira soteropolitanensis]MCW7492792.1 HPP family protein [Leptospira soteropolitanensis]MCW7500027.1 HPP family protein [Leptospira soteropolitanensis]MCW7522278.1 HPP family protein [Leptospira soteropolitanensis]MCW7526134.1 HPP family protein [Leptospira soteropolitanensis]MCW7529754.1 HPP family protein [Leptospira soteropolitanensis]